MSIKLKINKKQALLVFTMSMFFVVSFAQTPTGNRFKRIDYEYDLVSGKVNVVHYQSGQPDQMHHKYEYDADNRITNVYSSTDSIIWENDAKYFYYNHGPLARVEIGDQKVQALDYAYTIQGWIKGVNSNTLEGIRDPGKDGTTGSLYTNLAADIHSKIGRDAFGYSLSYYDSVTSQLINNGDDYSAINTSLTNSGNTFIANATASPGYMTEAPNLFNGNIKRMVTTITDITPSSPTYGQAQPQLTAYKYDQLNRIAQMKAYRDIVNNTFGDGTTYDGAYESNMSYDANGNIQTMKVNGQSGNTTMDNMNYQYDIDPNTGKKRSNKLYHVNDVASTYNTDIDDQGTFTPAAANNLGIINTNNNYGYDEIGNLVRDNQEEIENITWTVYGKINSITRTSSSSKSDLAFTYDASGNRVSKTEKTKTTPGVLSDASEWITTYYVRDASGNTMATYQKKKTAGTVDLSLQEQNLFGSSRLGIVSRNLNLTTPPTETANIFTRTLGKKQYELSNHLGNVLTTVTDRKLAFDTDNNGIIDYYQADISSAIDYYAFGSPMPGRNFQSNQYRYGFNGKESDFEIHNSAGSSYDFGARIYDPRLGRWLSTDQKPKAQESPYAAFSNSPVWLVDTDGKDTLVVHRSAVVAEAHNTKIYVVTFSIIKNGIETPLETKEAYYMYTNAEQSEKGYNDLDKKTFYKLEFMPMSNKNLGENTVNIFKKVFLHPASGAGDLGGCVGFCRQEDVKLEKYGDVTTFKLDFNKSKEAFEDLRNIYNEANGGKNGELLTGDKFILQTNSNTPEKKVEIPTVESGEE